MTTVTLAVTLYKGPEPDMLGQKKACFSIQLPEASAGWTATGITIPMDTWFDTIIDAWPGSNDTYADNAYKWGCLVTNNGATPATDLKLTAHYSTTAGGAMTAVPTNANLSAVGALKLWVVGT